MDAENEAPPPCHIPERVFKYGEEPVGVRVTPYHKPCGIRDILDAIDPEEIEQIRSSPFGKMVEIAEKPSSSGRFGRYIISRQLKVAKKHEAWFNFAGKPIRFSLREFAVVTGLNCGKFPKRSKKRTNRNISEKPYWGKLFGTLKDVPVSTAVRMLKKRTVSVTELRIKYAYLALVSSVILPTTHSPRISEDYAEMIKDLDVFLAYPWGRVSFDMLMSSIKERKEVALSGNTIALKGFVLALQLVMVEAVPAVTAVCQDESSSGSEDEYRGQEESGADGDTVMRSIRAGHAREIDAAGKAIVHSIISGGVIEGYENTDFEWSDDEVDPLVDNLVSLIDQGYPFTHSSFQGGVTKLDVIRLREESKAESSTRKTSKTKSVPASQTPAAHDVELLASVVKDSVKVEFARVDTALATLGESSLAFQTQVLANISTILRQVEECNAKVSECTVRDIPVGGGGSKGKPSTRNAATQLDGFVGEEDSEAEPPVHSAGAEDVDDESDGNRGEGGKSPSAPSEQRLSRDDDCSGRGGEEAMSDSSLDPALLFPQPSFSLGLTQEEHAAMDKVVAACVGGGDEGCAASVGGNIQVPSDELPLGCRKSKRQKTPPKSLLGNYECDKRFLNIGRKTVADSTDTGSNIDYSAKLSILLDRMKNPFSIETEQWTLESSELYAMVERSTPLSIKVVDVLISHVSAMSRANPHPTQQRPCVFLETQFVSELVKVYAEFTKASRKDTFRFPAIALDVAKQNTEFAEAERFYLPFSSDQKYWVGLCMDISTWTISVLDNNISIRSNYMMSREVRPLAHMFPYFVKQVGKGVPNGDIKPLVIDRPRCFPQHNSINDSAISAILFIQGHAHQGADGCKCITAAVLDSEVEKLAVTLFEEHVGLL